MEHHDAPSGLSLSTMRDLLSAFASIVNANHLPSGDHDKLDGDSWSWEITAVSPVSTQRMWIWFEPELFEIKAILSLSGDQRGEYEFLNLKIHILHAGLQIMKELPLFQITLAQTKFTFSG